MDQYQFLSLRGWDFLMINKLLKNYLELRPRDTFIHYKNINITYEDITYSLESRIKSLQAINIKKDSVIGIYLTNNLDLIEVLFACIEVQAIPMIIPANLTSSELHSLTKSIEFDYFITNWEKSKNLNNTGKPIFPIEELSPSIGGCAPSRLMHNDLDQIACLLLTSGTTGTPKVAQISINNIIASCNAWDKIFQFNKDDVYYNCLPLHHIGGLAIIFRALLFGFKVILNDRFDAEVSFNHIVQHKVNMISLVPTMLSRIIKLDFDQNISNLLRAVIIGGSDCSDELLKKAIVKNLPIYKSYGMTESCSGIAGFWVKDYSDKIDASGLSHDRVEFKIIENQIYIKGPSIIKKYYNSNVIDWHSTNDIGYIDKDGFLYVLGRKGFAVSGGENINIQEIDNIVAQHPKVKEAFFKVVSDDEWGDKLIAYIKSDECELLDIKDWLKKKLSNYKIPKEFVRLD